MVFKLIWGRKKKYYVQYIESRRTLTYLVWLLEALSFVYS